MGYGPAFGLEHTPMSEDLAGEHRDAAALARAAGQALMKLRSAPPELRDIGVAGDRLSHQFLVGELNRLYPGDDVRSEEGLEHVAGEGRLWIVDPLDGTTNSNVVHYNPTTKAVDTMYVPNAGSVIVD